MNDNIRPAPEYDAVTAIDRAETLLQESGGQERGTSLAESSYCAEAQVNATLAVAHVLVAICRKLDDLGDQLHDVVAALGGAP